MELSISEDRRKPSSRTSPAWMHLLPMLSHLDSMSKTWEGNGWDLRQRGLSEASPDTGKFEAPLHDGDSIRLVRLCVEKESLLEYVFMHKEGDLVPPCLFMYVTTAELSDWSSIIFPLNIIWNCWTQRITASSSRIFMCNFCCSAVHQPCTDCWPHTPPQPTDDASVVRVISGSDSLKGTPRNRLTSFNHHCWWGMRGAFNGISSQFPSCWVSNEPVDTFG